MIVAIIFKFYGTLNIIGRRTGRLTGRQDDMKLVYNCITNATRPVTHDCNDPSRLTEPPNARERHACGLQFF